MVVYNVNDSRFLALLFRLLDGLAELLDGSDLGRI
jgi:hypothetical protein